jgi:predicted DNA-binding protein (UPF0251 family)
LANSKRLKAYEYSFLIMPRPRKNRWICCEPHVTFFKPRGIPMMELEEVRLKVDELEAIRLKDLEGLEQEETAVKMGVSQPTLHRILMSAHTKTADSLVNGKALRIEGGDYVIKKIDPRKRVHVRSSHK